MNVHLFTHDVKEDLVNRMRIADEFGRLTRGGYYNPATHSGSPIAIATEGGGAEHFEDRTGLPVSVGWCVEAIYRGLPADEYSSWVVALFRAIPGGTYIDAPAMENSLLLWQLSDDNFGMKRLTPEGHEKFVQAVIDQIAGEVGNLNGWRAVLSTAPKGMHASAPTLAAFHAAEACVERCKTLIRQPNFTRLFGLNSADMLRCAAEAVAASARKEAVGATGPSALDESALRAPADAARYAMYRAQGKALLHFISNSPPKRMPISNTGVKTGRMYGVTGRFAGAFKV